MKSFAWNNIRLDSTGSPFRSVNAGLPEDDHENNERYNRGLLAFLAEYRGTPRSASQPKARNAPA